MCQRIEMEMTPIARLQPDLHNVTEEYAFICSLD